MTASRQNNPLILLSVLDGHLHRPFELCVYGRSALALGYPAAPEAFQATMDVDAILPTDDLATIETNEDFWQAQEATNRQLEKSGLYFTHLFLDRQVILTPDWRAKVVSISGFDFQHLKLVRPSTADLMLTKMMRVDPQDREDLLFLAAQSDTTKEEIRRSWQQAILPAVPEIAKAFEENRRWLAQALKL